MIALILVYVLSIPILIIGIAFDVAKLPVLLFFLWPIWGFLTLIDRLQGKDTYLICMMKETLFIGIHIWMDVVGLGHQQMM